MVTGCVLVLLVAGLLYLVGIRIDEGVRSRGDRLRLAGAVLAGSSMGLLVQAVIL